MKVWDSAAAIIRKSGYILREEGLITYLDRVRRAVTVRCRRLTMDRSAIIRRWEGLRGMFAGQRVFLIGNGPSLNRTPLHLLTAEHTMCFNRFNLMFERLAWRPTFFMTIDDRVLADMEPELDEIMSQVQMAFFPDLHPFNIDFRPVVGARDNVYWLWLDLVRFSDRLPYAGINKSVANVGLQVLAHLGFSDIYLIGVDMDYQDHRSAAKLNVRDWRSTRDDDPNHFDPRYFGAGRGYHHPRLDETIAKFKEARTFMEGRGVRVWNAGVGGRLDVFPRVAFRSLFEIGQERELDLLLAPLGVGRAGKTLRERFPEAVAIATIEDWSPEVQCALLSVDVAIRLIPTAIFTHVPYGPAGNDYLFVRRTAQAS